MTKNITENLTLKLSVTYSDVWQVWLYNDETGLSLQVGDPYYTTKYKAEKALAEAFSFLKFSLKLNEVAA